MSQIPKIIHYCWFGHNPMPKSSIRYINGWKKLCPDYKIIKWSEKNFNINKYLFTRKAYRQGNWAAVSDYARLIILYKFGGIYLDTDVEMLKSLNPLLMNESFIGMEDYGVINNGLVYGSHSKDINIKHLLNIYNVIGKKSDSEKYALDEVHIVTTYFHELGFKYNNNLQNVNGCTIYPVKYFCPERYGSNKLDITSDTYTIHHYFGTWTSNNLFSKQYVHFILRKLIRRIFGTKFFFYLYRKHMYDKKKNL